MRVLLQRVLEAAVKVDGKEISQINRGFLAFVGIEEGDAKSQVQVAVEKISKLRIFADEQGKSNLSISDIGGEILIISQFTLCANTKKGNRPSFTTAAPPDGANLLYEYFIECCQGKFAKTAAGIFGADMKVSLINDGPYTIIMDF